MPAEIFELWPAAGRREEPFRRAAQGRAEMARTRGFVPVERFESLHKSGKLLSLQLWSRHPRMTDAGWAGPFADDRRRAAGIVRDDGPRAQAPRAVTGPASDRSPSPTA